MSVAATDQASLGIESQLARTYRSYVLGVLVIVGALSWIDRQILAMVMQSVKSEFALSDSQLGLLGGTAFGLFYVAVGLPVAWLADRFNRRNIISASVALWSVMTGLCGLATGYWSLFLARMGVGVGEAGQAAPSQSIVCDYYPKSRRGFAMGMLYSYIPIGYLISYSAGGFFNDTIGWRKAFLLFGCTGIAVAILVRLTVREPVRGLIETGRGAAAVSQPGVGSLFRVLPELLRRPSMRHIPIAGAAHGIGMFGAALWLPSYFIRSHHMTATAVGIRLALIMGVAGLVGTLSGGVVADRLATRTGDERWYTWTCALAVFCAVPFSLAVYLSSTPTLALLLFIGPAILNHMFLGPVVATVQNLGGPRNRAVAAAMYLFLVNLISMGLGPLLVGVVSDSLRGYFGAESLRYSLMTLTTLTSSWAALQMFLASRTLRVDLSKAT